MQSDPKRPPASRPQSAPSPTSTTTQAAQPNRGFQRLTGAIVTLLLLALVALIVVTLLRFPIRPTDSDPTAAQAATATAPATNLVVLAPTFTPEPTAAAPTPEPPTLGPPTPSEPATPADAQVAESAPAESATSDAPTPSELVALPTPNAAVAPAPALQLFANANTVNDVALEGDTLWAATTGGALRWDLASATATTFSPADGVAQGPLNAVVVCAIDGFGTVFGGSNGLQVYDAQAGGWQQIGGGAASLAHNDVASLACDADQGLLAVGYAAEGVDIYRARLGRWSYTKPADSLFAQGVHALAIGPGGVVWAASGGALVEILGGRVTAYTATDSPLTGEAITALRTDADGVLWITVGNRLLRLKDGTWESYDGGRAAADFPNAALVDVAPSQSGRAWLLSEDSEVCRFDPEFESCAPFYVGAEGMALGPATALDADAGGTVAYGTAGQGSSLQARGQWSTLSQPEGFPASNRVFALASDAHGFLWVATTSGVQMADPAQPAQVGYRFASAVDGVAATNVRALFADARGGVWLGGIGASYFDGARWTNYTQADGLAGDEITAIAEDSQGRVWFGTRTGLSIWTGTTFFNLTGANGLPDSDILSLAADGQSMWIGSANGGLYRFENNQLQVLTNANVGLPSDRVTALLVTGDGATLVGTEAGLARFEAGVVTVIDSVPATRITTLAIAPGGAVWAGTADSGLFVAEDGAGFAPYVTPGGGALTAAVRAITVDLYGNVWVGGDSGGLARIAPE